MSKFCGIISKRLNSEELSPLCYDNLDTLNNWLHEETVSLQEEFQTKAEFVQDQQLQILSAENNLVAVHEMMRALEEKMRITEQHIEVHETNIKMLEANISALEDYNLRPSLMDSNHVSCLEPAPTQSLCGEQGTMLQLLQDTDNAMLNLNTMINEIEEHLPFMGHVHNNPYTTITNILECYVRTLQQTEQNLDCLVDKLNTVNQFLQHTMTIRQQRSTSAPPTCSNTIGDGDGNQNMPVRYY